MFNFIKPGRFVASDGHKKEIFTEGPKGQREKAQIITHSYVFGRTSGLQPKTEAHCNEIVADTLSVISMMKSPIDLNLIQVPRKKLAPLLILRACLDCFFGGLSSALASDVLSMSPAKTKARPSNRQSFVTIRMIKWNDFRKQCGTRNRFVETFSKRHRCTEPMT